MSNQSMNFEGLLNDLQNWENTLNGKDQLNNKDSHKGKMVFATLRVMIFVLRMVIFVKLEVLNDHKQTVGISNSTLVSSGVSQHRPPTKYDPLSHMSSTFMTNDNIVDASSEKDLGNEYFKQKKFNEAIDCYSRSIALSPTAVAYANRAMAYLKIKRYQEAEDDCTEALNLDDRYIKAYSRRATARKELKKLRDSLEDVEFALRLEPQNVDLKKQHAEVKFLLEKAILAKAAGTDTRAVPRVKEIEKQVDDNGYEKPTLCASERSNKVGVDVLPDNIPLSLNKTPDSGERDVKIKTSGDRNRQKLNGLHGIASSNSPLSGKKELGTSFQELASRAASRAIADAATTISTPKSAYQFEITWKGLCGDRSLQARMLKATRPDTLPQIFKNALTAPLLIDIVKCVASFFVDETELAVSYLQNLTKIPRFDMIILCLPPVDRDELCRIWNNVFLSTATTIELGELLSDLHPKYCPRRFR
ncbi:uncharacterized protein LOC130817860 isoform X2 [Amaranthus tricolor]|uniref:uncharacterized protein LOC130817860 isoform X2 n=1 Tax=Amaranthus tricolor TaxID=29722 RepID=UPI00258CDF50|nr:uncharacterized protein LOC130817860 isoform X2 [Amaranthus tricolor]